MEQSGVITKGSPVDLPPVLGSLAPLTSNTPLRWGPAVQTPPPMVSFTGTLLETSVVDLLTKDAIPASINFLATL